MPSTNYDKFSVLLYSDDGKDVTYNVKYSMMSVVKAQAKDGFLEESNLFDKILHKDVLGSFLKKYNIHHDSKKIGFWKVKEEPGNMVANIDSFSSSHESYQTTFPYMNKKKNTPDVFKRFYYCTCPAGKNRGKDTELLMCTHTAYGMLRSGTTVGKLRDPELVKISARIIEKLNSEDVDYKDIYQVLYEEKKAFKRRMRENFQRTLGS